MNIRNTVQNKLTRRTFTAAWGLTLGNLLSPVACFAETHPDAADVEHLLTFVATSGCEFYRNGTWYAATQAEAHLREKLAMVTSKNQVLTAEEFIEKVATKSAFTNIAYQIRCAGQKPIAVSDWLREELRHFRM
jgi:hypothetical protein